jgi:hypothetical protein
MDLEVPKRPIFKPTISIVMVQQVLQGARQQSRDLGKEICFNIYLFKTMPNVTAIKRREGEKVISKKKRFQNCPFWAYIKKIITSTSWCMVTPLGPHSVYT